MFVAKVIMILTLAQGVLAQSGRSGAKTNERTGVVSMNRNWISSLIEVDGEKLKLNLPKLKAMQAREAGSLKGMCPEGQEFKDAVIDFSASTAVVADAHLSAFSAVIGTRWQVVTLPEYGRDYNPQYIKLDRTISEIRQMKHNGELDEAKMKDVLERQKEIVQQAHKSSEAHLRLLIQKMQSAEPPKKSGALKLPFPIRYTCQPKENSANATDGSAADTTDAVQ